MDATYHSLFATPLVTVQFPDADGLNGELYDLFRDRSEFAAGFDMHPDGLNLLRLAGAVPAIARLKAMFLEGLKLWLAGQDLDGLAGVDLVLFSNLAGKGEQTLVHNHNADVVGIYYARTAGNDRPPVHRPGAEDDYFEVGDGVLILHDPRFNANLTAGFGRDYVKIFPRPGLMLLFPGYLWHSVTPHLGEARRLSLAMNFTLRWRGDTVAEHHPLA